MSDETPVKCSCTIVENDEAASGDPNSNSVLRCCVKQRNWSLLHSERFSDVSFIVGSEPDTQKISAHKNILSIGSSVFETMFSKNWSSKSKEIKVPDIDPASFSSLLRFIYTDDIELTAESVLKVLYAAKKYAVFSLEKRCADFLEKELSPENACLLLTQARLFDQPTLMKSCLEVIDENPESAFMSDSFTCIDAAGLRSILERSSLCIVEIELFRAVVRWSVSECGRRGLSVNPENQKSVLNGAELLIRFPLMTQKEFAMEVVRCGLLSKDDIIDIYQYFSGVATSLSNFSSTPRLSKELFAVQRLELYGSWMNERSHGIRFSFNCSVKLVGFGLYVNLRSSDTRMEFMVKNHETAEILYQSSANHESKKDSNIYTFRVFLEQPIRLIANTSYAVITRSMAHECYYGWNGTPNVTVEDVKRGRAVTVTFQNMDCDGSDIRTCVKQGQIPEILFNW